MPEKLPIVKVKFNEESKDSLKDKIGDVLDDAKAMDFYMELNDLAPCIVGFNEDIIDVLDVGKKYADIVMDDFDVIIKYDNAKSTDIADLCEHLIISSHALELDSVVQLLGEMPTFDCEIEIRIKKG